jgi:hypothetical protein
MKRRNTMNLTAKTALFSAVLTLTMVANQANAYVRPNLVVQPLAATNGAQDILLHADDNGSTYLYVERQQGALLSVYDVTDPAHMKLDVEVETGAHTSYDFVSGIGDSELVAFRDGSGGAVLDLHMAKTPKLAMIAGQVSNTTELLGDSGYLSSSSATPAPDAAAQPGMVQVVETAVAAPRLVSTVPNVTKQVRRQETGTTFLLGKNGVTVVRQINTEHVYEEQLALWNSAN